MSTSKHIKADATVRMMDEVRAGGDVRKRNKNVSQKNSPEIKPLFIPCMRAPAITRFLQDSRVALQSDLKL